MANRNAGYGARRGGFWFYLSRAGANDSSGRVSKFTEKTRRKISFFDIRRDEANKCRQYHISRNCTATCCCAINLDHWCKARAVHLP